MPSANITFVEFGSASPPASAARVVAKIGVCSAGSANSVYAFDVPGPVAGALGEGPLTEATAQAVRISKQRTLALPVEKNAPGELGPIAQEGSGPALLVTGEPRDSATARVKITKEGGFGVGRFRISTSGTAAGATVVPRYRDELTIPTRKRAELTGTRDLSKLAYAKAALVEGSAKLDSPGLFGVGGALDGKDVTARINGGGEVLCKLAAPANAAALLAALGTAFSSCAFALSSSAALVWSTKDLGEGATIEITGGSALALLGLAVGGAKGKAGALDGKAATIREGAAAEVAVVFDPPPSGPADVVARFAAVSNVDAGLVAPASKLRLASKAIGAGSSFAILGGDACEVLGLPIAAAKGAEATAVVPGLGVVIEFPEGSFVKDTVYTFVTGAPAISIDGVLAAIDKLVALRASFRVLHVVGELADAAETRALAEALDTKIGDLEDKKRPIIAIIGAPLAESDEALAAAFEGFVSRRVCVCARGAWLRGGTLPGSFLRSQSWAAAYKAAAFRYSSDLGNHDDKPLREVDALPVDEALATVKLRAARFTVMDTSGGNVYFARGLTMARETSHYRDLNVARVMIEAYLAAQPILDNEINNDPPLNEDGTLEGTTASAIDRAIVNALAAELVPEHATRVVALVNRGDNIWQTNHLRAQIKVVPRGQIYEVSAELGPGLAISEEG
jgi:hypothetical protein